MFYCREKELSKLDKRYYGNEFECIVIYGRRRVGKTALINEFCKDKPAVFFSVLNSSAKENLEMLSRTIYEFKNPGADSSTAPVYRDFDDAFSEITRLSENDRLIFVIDEYPYLAKADNSVSSRLQHIIDHVWSKSKLFLILCGSSISFMEYKFCHFKVSMTDYVGLEAIRGIIDIMQSIDLKAFEYANDRVKNTYGYSFYDLYEEYSDYIRKKEAA